MTVWCFEPTVLGHAQLLTPDVPASVACLLAMWFFRGYLLLPSWGNAFFFGLTLGLALLTKFTSLVLLPVCLILLLVGEPIARPMRWRRVLVRCGHAGVGLGTALLLINLDYEFTKFGRPLGSLEFISDWFVGQRPESKRPTSGNRFRGTLLESIPLPLPADYLHGMDVQRRDFEVGAKSVNSFLAGEWKAGGWWYYYLYAFAIKVPLGFIFLVAFGLLGAIYRPRREDLILYLPGLAIFALVSSQTGFNHHFRYVLPSFPFLIVGAGKMFARWETISRSRLLFGSVALTWGVAASLWFAPHHLSYFNESIGGPKNGYHHLVDSNIDWGQDLILLKNWLDGHPEAAGMRFALFYYPDLENWGLKEAWPPVDPSLPGDFPERGPQPGWYAVSVNALQGRHLLRNYPRNAFRYFNDLTPVGRIGYSIYLYHIPDPP